MNDGPRKSLGSTLKLVTAVSVFWSKSIQYFGFCKLFCAVLRLLDPLDAPLLEVFDPVSNSPPPPPLPSCSLKYHHSASLYISIFTMQVSNQQATDRLGLISPLLIPVFVPPREERRGAQGTCFPNSSWYYPASLQTDLPSLLKGTVSRFGACPYYIFACARFIARPAFSLFMNQSEVSCLISHANSHKIINRGINPTGQN